MKKSVFLIFVAGLFIFSGVAFAIEFSADAVMSTKNHSATSKMYLKDKKIRMESQGQQGYQIIRGDKNVIWMVMPSQKSYMEMKPDPSKAPKVDDKVRGEVSRKLIGSETIDGHPTQKYEITAKVGEKTEKMYQWMATDLNFPIKSSAIDGSWTMQYKNIKMGGQSDSLFEVPAGYSKQVIPSMPSGMPKGMKMPKMPRE